MSAPPRSMVRIPRLRAPGTPEDAPAASGTQARVVVVGPGGGQRLTHALCLAKVEVSVAVCTRLRIGMGAPVLTRRLGFARALVAIGRHRDTPGDPGCAAGEILATLEALQDLAEPSLLDELTDAIVATPWPEWVPPVAMARHAAITHATDTGVGPPRYLSSGEACPLTAARLVAAIHGPLFLRDRAPSIGELLEIRRSPQPSLAWELWLPVLPGSVRIVATKQGEI